MSDMMNALLSELGPSAISMISEQIGANEAVTQKAVPVVLATLLGSMAHNAQAPTGAQSLSNALSNDHDGSILGDIAGFVLNSSSGPGASILGHILGTQQQSVESEMANSTGMSSSSIAKLLPILAPIVLGYLGKQQSTQGWNAGDLASILMGEKQKLSQNKPADMGMLGGLLDSDNDGDISDDVASIGIRVLGSLFS